ncbi:MAG: penicillin acylase family protein [Solirubrobacterales bacterium]
MRRQVMGALAAAIALTALASAGPTAAAEREASPLNHVEGHIPIRPDKKLNATIRWTKLGIPHIRSRSVEGVSAGYGYAYASQNICTIAAEYVTVSAKRSKFFGPDEEWFFSGNGSTYKNVDADFYFKWVNDQNSVRKLLTQKPPLGPKRGVREGVKGYVRGYNHYLKKTGVENIPDPACRGEEWVKKINQRDVYRRFYQLGILASSGAVINGISTAEPVSPAAAQTAEAKQTRMLDDGEALERLQPDVGSNAYGFGKELTANGKGLVLGNPHFPWDGSERLFQAQLQIPGKLNVEGASLGGVPLILIGATKGLAWSHTVATAWRFTPFKLTLPPGDPYSYIVDGEVKPMEKRTVSIPVLNDDGSISRRSRDIYSTEYGPMITDLVGIPLPWTEGTGFALRDVNATNFRYLNHFFENNYAQSVREYDQIQRKFQGLPWVNSIAADSTGETYYAMQGSIPNVPDELAARCNVGQPVFEVLGLPILDGARSDCNWEEDPTAVAPGTFPADEVPSMFRDDYVHNGNDSHWLTNPSEPLEGFNRIIGIERAERTFRTRLGLVQVADRIAGTDGLEGNRFDREILQDVMVGNRQYLGELWRDELVSFCDLAPGGTLLGSSGPVDVSESCDVLRNWDLRDDLDSAGSPLFRRFASNLLGNFTSLPTGLQGSTSPGQQSIFTTPYSNSDPVNTPRGLNVANPLVGQALADAVTDLEGAGIPIDSGLRGVQSDTRGGEEIPIHGGPGTLGVFNAINVRWDPETGYDNVPHGSSFVMAAQFTDSKCGVELGTFVTYGQSENQTSPHANDYTKLFSDKQWHRPPFCRGEVRKATLRTERLRNLGPRPGRREPGPGDPPVGPNP